MKQELAIAEDTLKLHQAKVERIKAESNISKRFATRTFENFDVSENEKAYKACKMYVDAEIYNTEKNGLIICGSYGTGKTHLAAAIANSLMDEGVSVLFNTYGGHLEHLKAEYNSDKPKDYLGLMCDVELLVLDDVGKEKQSEWSESVMFEVINSRYEKMKPIIVTSNYSSTDLENYFGKACYSRLIEMCHGIVTQGRDYRR